VAGGDVNGNGYGDVVVGRGPGAKATVEVYSGRLLTVAARNENMPMAQPQTALLKAFTVLGGNGVNVAAADMNRDGRAEVVVGFDNAATVSIYDGLKGTLVSKKELGAAFKGGVRVAARAGQVMVASGPGTSPTIQLYEYDGFADGFWTQTSNLANEKIRGFTAKNTRGLFVG
jgi:FG-GAP-like repeat